MNAFLAAATALVVCLAPSAVVCARGRPIEGAIALQLCTVTTTLIVLCIAASSVNTTYAVVAVIIAALSPVSGLLLARMLGNRI